MQDGGKITYCVSSADNGDVVIVTSQRQLSLE